MSIPPLVQLDSIFERWCRALKSGDPADASAEASAVLTELTDLQTELKELTALHPEVTTLLEKYKEETGCPILLNTSFNDNGQPIVETPEHAVETFNNIDLDYLCIGNYIINKNFKDT